MPSIRSTLILLGITWAMIALCGCGGKNGLLGTAGGAALTGVTLTPVNPTITLSASPMTTQQFNAVGQYSFGNPQDITAQLKWVSADTTVAIMNSQGVATAVGSGRVIITGSVQDSVTLKIYQVSTILTVVPQLTAITVSPANALIAKGTPLNSDAARFHMPSSIFVDRGNGDIYVADGESTNSNRRIAVMDRDGKFLRQWKPEGMQSVHCLTIGNDGLVYVCNRQNARIQVYDKVGDLKRTIDLPWKPFTVPADGQIKQFGGATVAIDFSPDPEQKYMFVVNQNNSQIEMIERATGKKLGSFGHAGRYAGDLDQPHGIAVDSKGNVYVDENRGRRVHKFKIVQ